jgi:hypothetical protein
MKLSNYLTKDGKLTHMLKLEDTQGGFLGFTGMARIIEPSGEWRTERIPPDEPPIPGGQLTANQLVALAHQLDALDLLNLPNELRETPQANPHILDISFGDKGSSLTLRPGDLRELVPPPEDPEAAAVARFIALKLVIEFWTK